MHLPGAMCVCSRITGTVQHSALVDTISILVALLCKAEWQQCTCGWGGSARLLAGHVRACQVSFGDNTSANFGNIANSLKPCCQLVVQSAIICWQQDLQLLAAAGKKSVYCFIVRFACKCCNDVGDCSWKTAGSRASNWHDCRGNHLIICISTKPHTTGVTHAVRCPLTYVHALFNAW